MLKNSITRNYKNVSQYKKPQLACCSGLPTTEENTARGASSPENPALHIPEPLSKTIETNSSSLMFNA
jgi:hypothetical protein